MVDRFGNGRSVKYCSNRIRLMRDGSWVVTGGCWDRARVVISGLGLGVVFLFAEIGLGGVGRMMQQCCAAMGQMFAFIRLGRRWWLLEWTWWLWWLSG